MRERPILFSAPMVRALLAGTKTQTRRIVKASVPEGAADAGVISSGNPKADGLWWWLDSADLMDASPLGDQFRCPYGVPGDVLWVREGFRKLENASDHPSEPVWYMADGEPASGHWTGGKPSIHMPRWASRISLRITDVRVERLQSCSREDAEAEGVEFETADPPFYYVPGIWPHSLTAVGVEESGEPHWAVRSYAKLWEHINGPGSWAANPWVWAVSFERVTR